MVRVTVFGPTGETTHSVSPGRVYRVVKRAADIPPSLLPRLVAFFEKNDNCYRECFLSWSHWSVEERIEYSARCTAGEIVAAAGITDPTHVQVTALMDKAHAMIAEARANLAAFNAAHGSVDEPVARRRRVMRSIRGDKEGEEKEERESKRKRDSEDKDKESEERNLGVQLSMYREYMQQLRDEAMRQEREITEETERMVKKERELGAAEMEKLYIQIKEAMMANSSS